MRMIRHIVLINWKQDARPEQIDDWILQCNRIPDECSMVYNWYSSQAIAGPDPDQPKNFSTHQFCVMFDLRSGEEWDQYLSHPYPKSVYDEGMKIILLARTASTNMLVEGEPLRIKSQIETVSSQL